MATIDALVMIHGIVPSSIPGDHRILYNRFYNDLVERRQQLSKMRKIYVEYGHLLKPGPAQTEHEKLTLVQNRLEQKVMGMDGVETLPFWRDLPNLMSTNIFPLMIRGIGDAIYYCSAEGERAIRKTVYDQILKGVTGIIESTDAKVRLHIVCHSLGVTVAHDFLFTLFKPDDMGASEYCNTGYGDDDCVRFLSKERKQNERQIILGSFITLCSQLPLFVMRKQSLIDNIYQDIKLDLRHIGIREGEKGMWRSFFDKDDILAYSSNWLYRHNGEIIEKQIKSGSIISAHEGIWDNKQVHRDTADRIAKAMVG